MSQTAAIAAQCLTPILLGLALTLTSSSAATNVITFDTPGELLRYFVPAGGTLTQSRSGGLQNSGALDFGASHEGAYVVFTNQPISSSATAEWAAGLFFRAGDGYNAFLQLGFVANDTLFGLSAPQLVQSLYVNVGGNGMSLLERSAYIDSTSFYPLKPGDWYFLRFGIAFHGFTPLGHQKYFLDARVYDSNSRGELRALRGRVTHDLTIGIWNEGLDVIYPVLGANDLASFARAVDNFSFPTPPEPGPVGVQFSQSTYTVRESARVAPITVERTGALHESVTIQFNTVEQDLWPESPMPDTDYWPTNGTLTLLPGVRRKSFGIRLVRDKLDEKAESVRLALHSFSPNGVLGERATATLILQDDDTGGRIQFASANLNVRPTSPAALIVITRTAGLASNVTVRVESEDLTARAGTDYIGLQTRLELNANQTRAVLRVPILNDELARGTRSFALWLSDPTGGAELGARTRLTVNIRHSD